MGIGISIFLIALGAVLAFAVEVAVSGVDLDTIGVILMVVGAIGLVASLVMWGGLSRPRTVVEDSYVEEAPVSGRQAVRRDY